MNEAHCNLPARRRDEFTSHFKDLHHLDNGWPDSEGCPATVVDKKSARIPTTVSPAAIELCFTLETGRSCPSWFVRRGDEPRSFLGGKPHSHIRNGNRENDNSPSQP